MSTGTQQQMKHRRQLFDALRAGAATVIRGGLDETKCSAETWLQGSMGPNGDFKQFDLNFVREVVSGTDTGPPTYIEVVPLLEGKQLVGYILCDEEAKLKRIPANTLASRLLKNHVFGGVLNGTIIVVPCGYVEQSD